MQLYTDLYLVSQAVSSITDAYGSPHIWNLSPVTDRHELTPSFSIVFPSKQ